MRRSISPTLNLRPVQFSLAVSVLLCTTVACRQPTSTDRMLGARALSSAPSSDGSCKFDLTGDKGDNVFFVLGLLNEYNGRYIMEDSDQVEGFYCNEATTARLFRRSIGALAQNQNLDPFITEATVQECLLSYHSIALADRLNSCYVYQTSAERLAQGPDGTRRRTASASLSRQLFSKKSSGAMTEKGLSDELFYRRRALAYISGAWARYGRDKDFVFANAHDKAMLVAGLLMALGCHDIRLESTVGNLPQANIVHFQPTDEVMEWLTKEW